MTPDEGELPSVGSGTPSSREHVDLIQCCSLVVAALRQPLFATVRSQETGSAVAVTPVASVHVSGCDRVSLAKIEVKPNTHLTAIYKHGHQWHLHTKQWCGRSHSLVHIQATLYSWLSETWLSATFGFSSTCLDYHSSATAGYVYT